MLGMKINGDITLDEFKRMMDKTRVQAANIHSQMDEMEKKEEIVTELQERIDRLKRALEYGLQSLKDGIITRDFVDNYIKKIAVKPLENGCIELKIQILTDDIIQREFQKLRGRTGQESKKMIESYEKNL